MAILKSQHPSRLSLSSCVSLPLSLPIPMSHSPFPPFCTLPFFRNFEVTLPCEFSSRSEFGLTRPKGGKTLSKTKRSDKTLKRSQEMCDQNAPIHAETIWKLHWKGQLSTHSAQKSLKTCGQQNTLPRQHYPYRRRKEFVIRSYPSSILASLLGGRAEAKTAELCSWSKDYIFAEIKVPHLPKQKRALMLLLLFRLCTGFYPANCRV